MAADTLIKLARRYSLRPRGVIHVGAHLGEEAPTYARLSIGRQFWIEPQPAIYERLIRNIPPSESVRCANVACGATPARLRLNVIPRNPGHTDKFGLSSLLQPKSTAEGAQPVEVVDTIEVPVVPLDDLLRDNDADPAAFNLLVLDTQGYELEVLRGAKGLLANNIEYILTEVSRTALYEGSCLEPEIDAFLAPFGFTRVYSRLSNEGHGDALYIRDRLIPLHHRIRVKVMGPKVRIARPRASTPTAD